MPPLLPRVLLPENREKKPGTLEVLELEVIMMEPPCPSPSLASILMFELFSPRYSDPVFSLISSADISSTDPDLINFDK
jgi:hypothetical protein